MPNLFNYNPATSAIHRLPAGLKFATAIAIILGNLAIPHQHAWILTIPASLLLIIAIIARISFRNLLARILFLEPLVIGVAALSLLRPEGLSHFTWLLARSNIALLTMILLASTTSVAALVLFLKKCHVPDLLTTTIFLMCSYLVILSDESHRMRRARDSRTFTKRRFWQWRTTSMLIAQMFIRASERAQRVYGAMASRGWQ